MVKSFEKIYKVHSNLRDKTFITKSTPLHLASVSKITNGNSYFKIVKTQKRIIRSKSEYHIEGISISRYYGSNFKS
jgi:hypothetical protein